MYNLPSLDNTLSAQSKLLGISFENIGLDRNLALSSSSLKVVLHPWSLIFYLHHQIDEAALDLACLLQSWPQRKQILAPARGDNCC
jgi:hypothetical protein